MPPSPPPERGAPAGPSDSSRDSAYTLGKYLELLNEGRYKDAERLLRSHPELKRDVRALETIDALVEDRAHPSRFAHFEILSELGRGGMGVVYEAKDTSLGRRVALKVLLGAGQSDATLRERFRREARITARLSHPNIVRVLTAGHYEGTPYIVMEYVDGETLQELLPPSSGGGGSRPRRHRPTGDEPSTKIWAAVPFRRGDAQTAPALSEKAQDRSDSAGGDSSRLGATPATADFSALAELFAGVADGLQAAHSLGIVHRDIKPSNLILDRCGDLRILDFGLARAEGALHLTMPEERLGTPLYMSPEQTRGNGADIGPATDIYSLGVTLYEVLAGRPAFEAPSRRALMSKVQHENPPPPRKINPNVPRQLEAIVSKCMRKRPAGRYATAEALAQDLRRFARGDPVEARPLPWWEKAGLFLSRNKVRLAVASVFTSCLFLLAYVSAVQVSGIHARKEARYETLVTRAVMGLYSLRRQLGTLDPHFRSGRYAGGLFRPEDGVYLRPGDIERLAHQAKNHPLRRALNRLAKAVRLFPERPDARFHSARAALLTGDREAAAAELETLLRDNPEFVPALCLLAEMEEKAGNSVRAQELRTRAARGGDVWAPWIPPYARGTGDGETRRLLPETFLLTQGAEENRPYIGATIDALLGHGLALLESGAPWDALECFLLAQGRWPKAHAPRLLAAKTYLVLGRPDQAAAALERLHSVASSKDLAALLSAETYASLDYDREALAWAQRIVDPRLKHRTRAALHVKLGESADALREAKRAIALDPNDPLSRIWFGLALLSEAEKEDASNRGTRMEAACTAFTAASRLDPLNPLPRVWLGDAFARLGDLSRALEQYKDAVRLDPRNPWIRISVGVTLERKGDLRGALEALVAAFERDPELLDVYLHLQRLFEKGLGPDCVPAVDRLIRAVERLLVSKAPHPLFSELLQVLSLSLLERGEKADIEQARRYAERAVAISTRRKGAMLVTLARCRFASGDGIGAVRCAEEALEFPHVPRRILEDLERYRRSLLDLASFASVDAALLALDAEELVRAEDVWRYFPGTRAPAEGLLWTEVGFDDSAWKEGPGGFGYGDDDDATHLDMQNNYSTVYIRRRFTVRDPSRFRGLELSVRFDDGFVAYLNGARVAAMGVDLSGEPLPYNGFATEFVQSEPLQSFEFKVDPALLEAGDNVLALQGLNATLGSSDFSLIPSLRGFRPAGEEADRRFVEAHMERHPPKDVLEAGRLDKRPSPEALLVYLRGRVLERAGRYDEAEDLFEALVSGDADLEPGSRPEPSLALARTLQAAGRVDSAESGLREILRGPLRSSREVWEAWFALAAGGLRLPPSRILHRFPETFPPATDPRGGASSPPPHDPAADFRWALEELEHTGAIRINCGGDSYRDPRGRTWGGDRFFGGGYRYGGVLWEILEKPGSQFFGGEIHGTTSDTLYRTERWFRADEVQPFFYRVPVAPGNYAVTLHFAEVFFRERRKRIFDILVEDRPLAVGYEPLRKGFASADILPVHEVAVRDGFLDITFVPHAENPKISAFEIVRLP